MTIGNTTVTVGLGSGGVFLTRTNTRTENIVDVQPFPRPPSDTPTSGAVRLRSSSVTVLSDNQAAGKGNVNAQARINGRATLSVAIDSPGATSPCDTGIELGTFEIQIENGVVSSVSPALPLTISVLPYLFGNDVTMCLAMESDFDGTVRIGGLDLVFGPSQNLPVDQRVNATFETRNLDGLNVHILKPGEDFGDENRYYPGEFGNVTIQNVDFYSLVTFRAGRDGVVLDDALCPPINVSSYFAIVEWNGAKLDCYFPRVTPTPTTTSEACCLPPPLFYAEDGHSFAERCVNLGKGPFLTQADCRFEGGILQGVGTSCDNLECFSGFEACCFDVDLCQELFPAKCRELGGADQGFGVHCDSFPCASPTGPTTVPDEACCFDDGSCQDGDPEICDFSSGTSQGPGSTCATASCPQPSAVGACCRLASASCDDFTATECAANFGGFLGAGTTCATSNCTIGACCDAQGGCSNIWKDFCENVIEGGEYQGDDMDCISNPCVGGACCYNGQCTLATPHDCAKLPGEWVGGTTCATVGCAAPVEYVIWYTGNVSCWGAPLISIDTRDSYNTPGSAASYPGGGSDPSVPLVKTELQGGFASVEEARAWICPQFVSRFSHPWCSSYYQTANCNWQPGALGCDLSALPFTDALPAGTSCP